MKTKTNIPHNELIETAILGYETRIAHLREQLASSAVASTKPKAKARATATGNSRVLSTEARARISAAQKKRWSRVNLYNDIEG